LLFLKNSPDAFSCFRVDGRNATLYLVRTSSYGDRLTTLPQVA